ncbi:MAG: class aldolase and adducin N-terminal domain protein 3 [Noviherbaspirillum sp.]|nr:class aldolase and adducin N-terminal domain protein 3 [Noviherbaspirillum sp.]
MNIEAVQIRVRKAARAMGRHKLVHAYGHVSARLSEEEFLVCSSRPMGCIAPGQDGIRVPVRGDLPNGVLPEVRIHQQIYGLRPDVGGICRIQPPRLMSLSTLRVTPRPRNGSGTYFAPQPPLWDDPMLARSDEKAHALAAALGGARAIVMRGNGAVCVGANIEEAACMAFLLEDAASIELDVLQVRNGGANEAAIYTQEEVAARAVSTGGLFERMWDFLTFGDPE